MPTIFPSTSWFRSTYDPSDQGVEKKIKERVEKWRTLTAQAKAQRPKPKAGPTQPREQEQQ